MKKKKFLEDVSKSINNENIVRTRKSTEKETQMWALHECLAECMWGEIGTRFDYYVFNSFFFRRFSLACCDQFQ